MSRQKQLLAVLAVVFVLALIYAFWASPRPQRVAAPVEPAAPQRPTAEAPVAAPVGETRVRLDLLERKREKFAGYKRDIFNYPRPPSPPPRIVQPPPTPPPAPVTEPVPVPPEVTRELARFTFLGFLEKENVKTVFLSSDGEIFLVKNGQTFGKENEFQVTDLTPERLVIRHKEDSRIITVPLVEQAPLVPSGASRPIQPSFRTRADSGPPDIREQESPPPEEEEELLPPSSEGENVLQPEEEAPGEPSPGEEGKMENDISPPGGAADE